ncbi:hypothetical protein J6590_051271 [Homalodisca vitripennis]|nr:hypothetical protein J6590_051271 [Homalodisca vitripennis]
MLEDPTCDCGGTTQTVEHEVNDWPVRLHTDSLAGVKLVFEVSTIQSMDEMVSSNAVISQTPTISKLHLPIQVSSSYLNISTFAVSDVSVLNVHSVPCLKTI